MNASCFFRRRAGGHQQGFPVTGRNRWGLILVCAFAITVASSGQEPRHDVRMILGKEVDLTPVTEWFKTRKGPRPMPHWKRISVLSYNSTVSSWAKVAVRNEDHETVEILLAHYPLIKDLERRQAIQARLDEIGRGRHVAPAPTGAPVANQRLAQMAEADAAAMRREAEDLRAAQRKLNLRLEPAIHEPIFAMATGQKSSELEVWDCGVKK